MFLRIFIFIFVATLFCRVSWAQAEKSSMKCPKQEIEKFLAAGKKYYRQKKFSMAIREFEAAYKCYNDPNLLYNIAKAHEKQGDDLNAWKTYGAYLKSPNIEDKDKVEKFRVVVEKRLSEHFYKITVDTNPKKAQIFIDEVHFGETPIVWWFRKNQSFLLKIEKKGFKTKKVNLYAVTAMKYSYDLQTIVKTGRIQLKIADSTGKDILDPKIFLNDLPILFSELNTREFEPGAYALKVQKEGYNTYLNDKISVMAGETCTVKVTLIAAKTIVEVSKKKFWNYRRIVYITAFAVGMILMVPGIYEFVQAKNAHSDYKKIGEEENYQNTQKTKDAWDEVLKHADKATAWISAGGVLLAIGAGFLIWDIVEIVRAKKGLQKEKPKEKPLVSFSFSDKGAFFSCRFNF